MNEITDEQLADQKRTMVEALNSLSLSETAVLHTLKGYRQTSVVNAVFLLLFFLSTFLYPLVLPKINPFFYVALWAASISIFVLRVKLYLKITPKEMELAGLINMKALYENEITTIQKIEYDRLTGQGSSKSTVTAVPSDGEPAERSGEDTGSSEKESRPGAGKPENSPGRGTAAP